MIELKDLINTFKRRMRTYAHKEGTRIFGIYFVRHPNDVLTVKQEWNFTYNKCKKYRKRRGK